MKKVGDINIDKNIYVRMYLDLLWKQLIGTH